ncbi:uncharacterized protein G2W53_033357 [Senna tora]|uniref:Uncharacterized protein n=1 Tax=Senna tora TaxID=362788 RepID=A0A834SZ52_9FABA|nr:uncharacterized protein G2W53_033357 [Senna tora]
MGTIQSAPNMSQLVSHLANFPRTPIKGYYRKSIYFLTPRSRASSRPRSTASASSWTTELNAGILFAKAAKTRPSHAAEGPSISPAASPRKCAERGQGKTRSLVGDAELVARPDLGRGALDLTSSHFFYSKACEKLLLREYTAPAPIEIDQVHIYPFLHKFKAHRKNISTGSPHQVLDLAWFVPRSNRIKSIWREAPEPHIHSIRYANRDTQNCISHHSREKIENLNPIPLPHAIKQRTHHEKVIRTRDPFTHYLRVKIRDPIFSKDRGVLSITNSLDQVHLQNLSTPDNASPTINLMDIILTRKSGYHLRRKDEKHLELFYTLLPPG